MFLGPLSRVLRCKPRASRYLIENRGISRGALALVHRHRWISAMHSYPSSRIVNRSQYVNIDAGNDSRPHDRAHGSEQETDGRLIVRRQVERDTPLAV